MSRFGLDGLVTYLGFTLILIAAIGPNLTTTWPAAFCFALVASRVWSRLFPAELSVGNGRSGRALGNSYA